MVGILRLDPLPANLDKTRAQAVAGSAKNVKPTQPQVISNPTSTNNVGLPSSLPTLSVASAALEQTTPAEDPVADSLQLSVLQSRLAAFQVASLGLQGLGFSVPDAGARINELTKPRLEIKETKAI